MVRASSQVAAALKTPMEWLEQNETLMMRHTPRPRSTSAKRTGSAGRDPGFFAELLDTHSLAMPLGDALAPLRRARQSGVMTEAVAEGRAGNRGSHCHASR
jgi:hypothetical protein